MLGLVEQRIHDALRASLGDGVDIHLGPGSDLSKTGIGLAAARLRAAAEAVQAVPTSDGLFRDERSCVIEVELSARGAESHDVDALLWTALPVVLRSSASLGTLEHVEEAGVVVSLQPAAVALSTIERTGEPTAVVARARLLLTGTLGLTIPLQTESGGPIACVVIETQAEPRRSDLETAS